MYTCKDGLYSQSPFVGTLEIWECTEARFVALLSPQDKAKLEENKNGEELANKLKDKRLWILDAEILGKVNHRVYKERGLPIKNLQMQCHRDGSVDIFVDERKGVRIMPGLEPRFALDGDQVLVYATNGRRITAKPISLKNICDLEYFEKADKVYVGTTSANPFGNGAKSSLPYSIFKD
jgi:hypothetical protein